MATVVSLTQSKIEELMAGWEGVSLSQDELNAIVSQLWTDVGSQGSVLENFEEVVVPQLLAETNAASTALDNFTTNQVPALEADISANDAAINNLNTVTIPLMEDRLHSSELWIIDLNETILPGLYTDLAANQALIDEFNTVTLPDLNTRITAAEAAVEGLDLTALQADIDALEGKFPITGPDISADAIEANHIASHTITALEIAADTITANEIAADTITANEIAADTITAAEIAADTITANELAADSVTANEIAADSVTANEIAANTITAAEIAADTITANEIATDTITANEIAADTITANEIATDAITANEIAANAVTATELAANAVTAVKIAASTITGEKIAADTIDVSKLIISDLTNLAVDGDLQDPTSKTWHDTAAGVVRVKDAGQPAYLKNRNTAFSTHIWFRNENVFEIKAGDEFYVSLEVSTPATNTEDLELNPSLSVYDVDGAHALWRNMTGGPVVVVPNTPWTKIEGTIPIDAMDTAVTAKFNPFVNNIDSAANTQEIRLRKFILRRKSRGSLIVDGTIQGKHLAVNTITADQIDTKTLTGDLFASKVVLSGLVQAGEIDEDTGLIVGGYSQMGSDGMFTVDELGNAVASLPTSSGNQAFVKAHMELLSAEVMDNFRMHGTNNSIATEGELTLDAGVTPPSNPPVLSEFWDTLQLDKTTSSGPHVANTGYNLGNISMNPSQITSIDWDAEWNNWAVCQQRSNGFRIWRFNSSGTFYKNLGTGRNWHDDYNDRTNASICYNKVRGGISHLSKSGDDWYIWGKTPGGTDVINKIPNSWIIDADSRPPKLSFGQVSENCYKLVQNNGGGTGTIHVRSFTLNTGSGFPNATSIGTNNFAAETGMSRRINGAIIGPELTGSGSNWAITVDDYGTFYAFTGAGTPLNTNGSYHQWSLAAPTLGSCWTGTQFASIDSAGKISFYENWNTTQYPTYMWFGASAYDSTAGDGNLANPHTGQSAGQHETPVGTMVRLTPKRRSKVRITMPETNDSGGADDPDKWKVYFVRTTTTTTPTDKTLLKYVATLGSPTAPTNTVITADPIGGQPPGGISGQASAINNFPAADPARIESSALDAAFNPYISLRGDGAGRTGPLEWTTVGVVSTTPVPVGTVLQVAGSSVPADFLKCEGQSLSTATYPALFAAIGYTWGGSGTSFNVPDLRRRFIWGAVGPEHGGVQVGYTDTVATPSSRNPQHSHTVAAQDGGTALTAGTGSGQGGLARFSSYDGHAHGGDTGTSSIPGASTANAFPNAALQFIIKAK